MRFRQKSSAVVFACILALGLVVSAYLSNKVYAQSPTNLVLYDNFDERFLNPAKWSLYPACFTGSVLECVREIQDDKLRLAVRSYGVTNSNQGNGYGPSELHFTNPTAIRRFAASVTVRQANGTGCSANTGTSVGHALLEGHFFNSGSGNPNDDVQALLLLTRSATDPEGVLSVVGLIHWQGQFFPGLGIGTINLGQKVVAQLSWDQPNHQFVVSWTDVLTSAKTEAFMPYTMPDITPPAAPDKLIGVRAFAPNCVGTQMMFAYLDATFDGVWIGN